jgi:hypothetical protein
LGLALLLLILCHARIEKEAETENRKPKAKDLRPKTHCLTEQTKGLCKADARALDLGVFTQPLAGEFSQLLGQQ